MGWMFGILLMLPVVPMVFSDFRRREVAVGWLVLFGAGCLVFALRQQEGMYGTDEVSGRMAGNLSLLGVLSAGIVLWLRVRNGCWVNPLKAHAGAGDVWFLVCLTPLWEAREFLCFLILSLVATLAGWGVYTLLARRSTTIPLVGTLGIAFCIWCVVKTLRI